MLETVTYCLPRILTDSHDADAEDIITSERKVVIACFSR